jgi:ribosomal protein S18 acetylase RimI-like enzyme
MQECFDAEYVSLHVRKSNHAAIHLYTVTLGYEYVFFLQLKYASPFVCSTKSESIY